jgi:hypothetical protein
MILAPAEGVSFLLLDEQPALFSAVTQQLFALNKMAALIWCCLESGHPYSKILDQLIASGVGPADAATYIHSASQRWLRLGLLQVDVSTFNQAVIASAFSITLGRLTWTFLVTSDRLADLLHQLFDNREPPRGGDRLKIIEEDGLVYVFHNDKCVLTRVINEVVPSIKAYLTEQLVTRCSPDIAFHAACLKRGENSLLISGRPGAGKTTLALHLVQHGFEYCGDDIVLISPEGSAIGVPFSPTIKPGAWQLLRQSHPGLAKASVSRRPDGKRVKYFCGSPMAKSSFYPVGWIVFLRRRSGNSALKLVPLKRLDALKRLLESSFSPDGRLSPVVLTGLKSMITSANSFELSYANTNEAQAAISAMCNDKSW